MRKTVAASMLAKGVRIATQAVIVGSTVRYLGPTQYGAWMTAMAALGWVSFGQFGVGPGLINALAEARGSGDKQKEADLFASALFLMGGVAVFLLLAAATLAHFLDIPTMLGNASGQAAPEATRLLGVCLFLVLLRFPLSTFESAYIAYQEGHLAQQWEIIGQVLSTIAALMLITANAPLEWLVLGIALASECAIFVGGCMFVTRHRSYLFPRKANISLVSSLSILRVGSGFFISQVAGFLILQGGVIILAYNHGTGSVTPYSVTWRLFMMSAGVWMMFSNALWGGFGEARSNGDWRWIDSAQKRLIWSTSLGAAGVSLALAIFGGPLIEHWAGESARPSSLGLVGISVFSLLFSWSVIHAQVLNAIGVVWPQVVPGLVCGILSILFSLLLVPPYGLEGLCISLSAAILSTLCWINPLLLRIELNTHVV
jgi:O-antigen/teichoic acid export membrane protein